MDIFRHSQFVFKIIVRILMIASITVIAACSMTTNNLAPVTNGWTDAQAASGSYRVQADDTLYSIAFRFGLDYRQLAAANNIQPPYHISAGQEINLLPGADDTLTTTAASPSPSPTTVSATPASSTTATVTPSSTSPSTTVSSPTTTVNQTVNQNVITAPPVMPKNLPAPTGPVSKWVWPAHGQIIHSYSDAYGASKGIDIAGTLGEPVHATAAGKVVYCGNGLRGYGLLIIVKHNSEYLSAYAHNSKALVQEGDVVQTGQVIALMGNSDASQVMLHFEIRQAGKPVNPLTYLPAQQG